MFFKRNFFIRMMVFAVLLFAGTSSTALASDGPAGFAEQIADVNGTRIHYFIGGKGSPVVLLHGYAETSQLLL